MNDATQRTAGSDVASFPSLYLTQRLWVLERRPGASGSHDTRHFTSAIALLRAMDVRVCFVRSTEVDGVEASCHDVPSVQQRVDRDARAFDSLDAALAWADTAKADWLRRGWVEVSPGTLFRTTT